MSLFSQVRESRELVRNLTTREIKGKYKSTVLGQLWSLITPVATMLVYTLVFSFIMRSNPGPGDPSGIDVFAVWLMCALLPWLFFTNVVNGGIVSLVANESLIKKVYFPRWALPVSTTLAALNQWSIEMALLSVVLVVLGLVASGSLMIVPMLPLILVAMVLLVVFALGIALMLAVANVYFRDTQHFVSIALQVWFYLTPIIYPARLVADRLEEYRLVGGISVFDVYQVNPMYSFAAVFRALLYDNRLPDTWTFVQCVAWAAVAIVGGVWAFRRNQGRLAEAL